MPDLNRLLKEYLDYLEIEKNRSPKTRENYERHLRAFFASQKLKALSDLTLDKVRDFRVFLARSKNIKKVTQTYYVIAIRNFLKYLIQKNHDTIAPDAIELPKIPKRQIDIIELADLERLLEAPAGNDLRALRDRAVLELFFSTGLRVSELCSLNRYLDFTRGELTVRGKGEKLRLVFVSDTAKKAIKAYLEKRGDALEHLFVSLDKQGRTIGKISSRSVQRLVNFYSRKAGITDRITPHGLRHLFATDLLMNGADLRSVQELLGHASVSTTQIYTHLTNKHLKEIHKNFHDRQRK